LAYLAYQAGWIQSLYYGQTLNFLDGLLNLTPRQTGWLFVGLAFSWHLIARSLVARSLKRTVNKAQDYIGPKFDLRNAFAKSTSYYHTIFSFTPRGWNFINRNRINKIREEADAYVQNLNDRYTNPSGKTMIEVQSQNDGRGANAKPEVEVERPGKAKEEKAQVV
jgi:hypothetical protein